MSYNPPDDPRPFRRGPARPPWDISQQPYGQDPWQDQGQGQDQRPSQEQWQGQGQEQWQGQGPGQWQGQDQDQWPGPGQSQWQGPGQEQWTGPGRDQWQDQGPEQGQRQGPGRYRDGFDDPGPYYQDPYNRGGYTDNRGGYTEPRPSGPMVGSPDERQWAPPDRGWDDPDPGSDPDVPERGRGLIAGPITGFLAAAVAIAVAILTAAFVRPQASPIIAIGGAFIDRTPTPLKEFAVEHFGENDKTMLLLGMYVTISIIAMLIGVIARRNLFIGVAGIALFGLFGAFVAITRPAARSTDAIPSIIGGIAGVVALTYLVRAGAPRLRGHVAGGGGTELDRRKFLFSGAAAAMMAAVAGVGGQILTDKRFSVNTASVKLVQPVQKVAALFKGLDIPGLSSFYTSNADFYRVDTALVAPAIAPSTWQLKIHGMVDNPMTINFDQLMKMPMIERDITIMCVSEAVGGNFIGNARWEGTLLAAVLRQAGIQEGAEQIVMTDVNGMNIGVSAAAVMDGRDALLAVGMNGQPLPVDHGFPVRVVVPGLYGYVSACKWVVDMDVTTYAAYTAYWTKRGWSAQAPIKVESRIDTPKTGATLSAGKTVIAGVAWAQHVGVERVEVSTDGGATWNKATLAPQDNIDTWRQWFYIMDTTSGSYTIEVRATNKDGDTQIAKRHGTYPNGATGYHTIQVTVA